LIRKHWKLRRWEVIASRERKDELKIVLGKTLEEAYLEDGAGDG
jgi:hypothetical protein